MKITSRVSWTSSKAQWPTTNSRSDLKFTILPATITSAPIDKSATTRQTASCSVSQSPTATPSITYPNGKLKYGQFARTHRLFWWARRVTCGWMRAIRWRCRRKSWSRRSRMTSRAGVKLRAKHGKMTMSKRHSSRQPKLPFSTSMMTNSENRPIGSNDAIPQNKRTRSQNQTQSYKSPR